MIKATKKDKELIVDILTSAFEPITIPNSINFVVKQDAKRRERLQVLMEYLFNNSLRFGEVFLSDNRKACALIQYPHTKKITLQTVLWDFKLALKCIGLMNVVKVLKRELALKKYHTKEPHIHPMILGTYSDERGKGHGFRLIKNLQEYYKDSTLPVIIETTTKENLDLYQYFGFEIFKETSELQYPLYFLRKNLNK
ncbi:GNAT family N-acetyltransferase [Tenacibaculum xiamenense]|uniref:GNAT family N-acetyltransferase n=1 Tax=Tenacibaculum xiamenense TaxID=1261553 RepID=UPI0038B652CE